MRRIFYLFLFFPLISFAQVRQPDAAQIQLKLKKLNVLGSALYVAAHPDDENTSIITYLANGRLVETAYLSMTRGDGGQNLIGPELRDLLGLIRTQELLSARRIDGGKQFFTRANDFGFSKSADETFKIWNKDEILSDVVKVFRQYQPDVIITRFPPDERAGHGHHTASAILAQEAFVAAATAGVFPSQVKQFGTWQVKRLYTNTGRWWNTTINENTPGIVTLNVGTFNMLLGQSYTEISATSRSQHKSQGFGSRGVRGDQLQFLEYIKGDSAKKDIFEGVNTTWSRVKGGEKIQPLVDEAIRGHIMESPYLTVPILFQIKNEIVKLEDGVWKKRKLKEVEELIADCLGLFLEVTADNYFGTPDKQVSANLEIVNRSSIEVLVERIESKGLDMDSTSSIVLKNNASVLLKTKKIIDPALPYSGPYWLKEKHGTGLFTVTNPDLIGKPESDPAINFTFSLRIGNDKLVVSRPLIYKTTDPVKGELTRPFEIVPPLFLNLAKSVFIFSDDKSRNVDVKIIASQSNVKGTLKLQAPEGWRVEPASIPFDLKAKGEEQLKNFVVSPSKAEITSSIKAIAEVNGKEYDQSLLAISYDHIPPQTLLPKAEAKLVRLNLKKVGKTIGYIKGAGDEVPIALRNMGYEVWEMKDEEINAVNLLRVDAVVLGIRAINTNTRMGFIMSELLTYAKNGGTVVVQYNTNNDLETNVFSPYELTLSRDRVTEEDAEVRMLKPDHALLTSPNKITAKDFEGWVQERGLYYPSKWDKNFEAILSMNDKGEPAKDGSLLVAKYGKGYYIYTGLSFFRELPEGVSGAYKLFANIVSIGKK
ncbi:MAG: PIG-L family deacetylase [Chryseolinea sp.]